MKWKKNQNLKPEIILKKLEELKQVNSDGSVSFSAFEYQNAMAALYSMVDFPKQFISLQNTNILKSAVSRAAKIGILNKDTVLNELKELTKIELSKKENKYSVLTSISMGLPLPIKSIKIGESNIKFYAHVYPKKYSTRIETLEHVNKTRKEKITELTPNQYTKIIISTKAKNELEAANKALNDFDLLRAIFCLFSNSGMELIGDQFSPINKIRLGEFHTVHNASGKNVNSSRYWFEPNYKIANIFRLQPNAVNNFEKNIKWCIKRLSECKYSEKLNNALLRYVRALDERDQNVALLQIWGALESLTAYEENNKGNLPRRCSFLYEDSEYHKQILEHLREYRNQSVHAGIRSEEVKNYCYQLQGYFFQLILFHLHRVNEFSTLAEANHFLDQPVNVEDLKKKKELLEKAIKYRQGE